ncbi:metallophosphoesterase [Paenibacillus psychroresistens]|uniref:Metallophosphoesterase n=1 Tax=Paenibacillus psychroresistens TaxID=1778678 RepID=A0A6B8RLN4_9BACL|nr:metallophosphoesterase [Paenibacillus psychroresistens]QGQ96336.1 metallophosphoesterase [Paenibacillus psychroresistens]
MKPRIIGIILTILVIFTAINYYIGSQSRLFINQLFDVHLSWIYWLCFWFIAYSYIIARLGARGMPKAFSQLLKVMGSYWFAIMTYSLLLLPLVDLIAWILHLGGVEVDTYIPWLGISLLVVITLIILRGSWNAWNPIVRKYEILIPKAAGEMKQLRIAAASDLHLGSIVRNKHLQRLVDQVKALKPDLILLPGDILDDDIEPFIRHRMSEQMQELKAPLGTYAILGNHEYIGGKIEEFVKQMKAIDIEVLMDRSVMIADSFYVIGRKDRSAYGRDGVDKLLEGVDKAFPLIMMDHQPYHLDQAAAQGIDLQLSGHTHRGQMTPFHWITKRLYELDWGYLKKGNMHTIVSSGFGSWGPPIRLGSRSEIIEIVIQFVPES